MKILVGISGGIAAYKAPELVRRLRDQGAEVRVVMTEAAGAFIGEMSLQAVSGHSVNTHLMDPAAEAAMGHIELSRWADAIIIAPATANLIAQLANGMANDLLSTLVLATTAPLFIAPAMNHQMWHHPATQTNIEILKSRHVDIIGPGVGDQACGETGPGRMVEPQDIANQVISQLNNPVPDLSGVRLMITAGPTQEAIDPVRYISNHSSGKMGYALARVAASAGARVTLVSGPVSLPAPPAVTLYNVTSASDMRRAVMDNINEQQVFIGCAAVADYRIERAADQKIKKNDPQLVLTMVKNPDIISEVASLPDKPFCVGFAAETESPEANGKAKLDKKGLDMICINDVSAPDIGFNSENNQLSVYFANAPDSHTIRTAPKRIVAQQLLTLIANKLN